MGRSFPSPAGSEASRCQSSPPRLRRALAAKHGTASRFVMEKPLGSTTAAVRPAAPATPTYASRRDPLDRQLRATPSLGLEGCPEKSRRSRTACSTMGLRGPGRWRVDRPPLHRHIAGPRARAAPPRPAARWRRTAFLGNKATQPPAPREASGMRVIWENTSSAWTSGSKVAA